MTTVAIVGAGLMGTWHAHAARRAGARVTAVADVTFDRAARLARRHRAAPHHDLQQLLAVAPPDLVQICTPLETHEALAVMALEAGCHVLVEKPLAPSGAVTENLLARAAQAGRLLCPVHQLLFQRGVLAVPAHRAALGPVRHVDYVSCTAGADSLSETRRAALPQEILPHPLSLMQRILPVPIGDAEWQVADSGDGEFRAVAVLGGTSIGLLISTRGRPTRHALRLLGERGTLHVDLFHGFAVFEQGAVSRARKILRPLVLGAKTTLRAGTNLAIRTAQREPAYPGLRELIRRLILAIHTDGIAPITPDETLAVARAMDVLASTVRS